MPTQLSPWFLELARCPVKKGRLGLADEHQLNRLNEAILAGQVKNTGGEQVSQPFEGGLVDSPPTRFYPIRDGIVSLVAEDAILLNGL